MQIIAAAEVETTIDLLICFAALSQYNYYWFEPAFADWALLGRSKVNLNLLLALASRSLAGS